MAELNLCLNTKPKSVFPRSTRKAESLGCVELFEKQATRYKYECWQDWLFCKLWPEHKRACRAYYRGEGQPLKVVLKGQIRKHDTIMARCISESYKQALKKNPAPAGSCGQEGTA